jgi:hypothetical protein
LQRQRQAPRLHVHPQKPLAREVHLRHVEFDIRGEEFPSSTSETMKARPFQRKTKVV